MTYFKALLFENEEFHALCCLDASFLQKHGITESSLLDESWADELKGYCLKCFQAAFEMELPYE
ncbi:MAG: hypothetical protein QM758_04470 [Armatimonas sp.]